MSGTYDILTIYLECVKFFYILEAHFYLYFWLWYWTRSLFKNSDGNCYLHSTSLWYITDTAASHILTREVLMCPPPTNCVVAWLVHFPVSNFHFFHFQGYHQQKDERNRGFGAELCQLEPPTSQRTAGRAEQFGGALSKQHQVSWNYRNYILGRFCFLLISFLKKGIFPDEPERYWQISPLKYVVDNDQNLPPRSVTEYIPAFFLVDKVNYDDITPRRPCGCVVSFRLFLCKRCLFFMPTHTKCHP